MTQNLIALNGEWEVGRVRRATNGRLSFIYDKGWQELSNAYPLSLSMPLTASEHSHARIDAFLWGLLPDNEKILQRWAQQYHVSARNAFGLIANVGEDCAGAVQFVRQERLTQFKSEPSEDEVQWISEKDVADRLRILREDHSAWRLAHDTGQFSLAGAQPKTTLLFQGGRWGIPSGRTPTTHILKPPTGEWDGHAENEHFCLELARNLDFIVATSRVEKFLDEIAIVIERYDRVSAPTGLVRVHQEDLCQALGLPPTKKYENEGGPGVGDIATLLRSRSSNPEEDVNRFVDALAFNWLIGGTDAHAKNYSILIGSGGVVRLAPLYDVASILPYKAIDFHKATLAMRIGEVYRIRDIGIRQWYKLAAELHIPVDRLIQRLRGFADALPDYIADVRSRLITTLPHPIISRMAKQLTERSRKCAYLLTLKVAT
jgi:serine/threonine-protein kinase HipA